MSLTHQAGLSVHHVTALPRLELPVSFRTIAPLVAAFDASWILTLGVATGLVYDVVALSGNSHIRYFVGSAIAVAVLFCAFVHAADLYRPSNLLRVRQQIQRAILIWIAAFVCLAAIAFLLKIGAILSRGSVVLFFACGVCVITMSRVVTARVLTYVLSVGSLARRQIVVVGTPDELASNTLLSAVERYGYAITRAFALPEPTAPGGELQMILRTRLSEVIAFSRANSVDEVTLAIPWARTDLIQAAEAALRVLPIPVKLIPDSTINGLFNRPLSELGAIKAVEVQQAPLSAAQRWFKQSMDRCLAALGLMLLMPAFAVTALGIRLESPGPAFFLQLRVGFNGRPFRIFKFRTMTTLDDGAVVKQATRDDIRVTRLGRLLRKLSVDEIPQLLNVLRGEMSLVGPRPHALAHDSEYDGLIASYAMRRKMKPGITGWAQVNGCRGETPEVGIMQRRVDYDLWYIEFWSIWLDLRILLMTVVQVLRPRNVY